MSYFPKPNILFDPSNQSAFGTLETAELTPVIQGDFINGINSQLGAITTANSASVDTAATTVTGGTLIYNVCLANGLNGGDSQIIDLTQFDLFVAPGEILSVSAFSTFSASVSVALNWAEDL